MFLLLFLISDEKYVHTFFGELIRFEFFSEASINGSPPEPK